MVVLCAFLFIACEKDNDDYEPIKPPVEQPEEPVKPEKPDEPEKPEKPTTPPATDDIINVKIGDSNCYLFYEWYRMGNPSFNTLIIWRLMFHNIWKWKIRCCGVS